MKNIKGKGFFKRTLSGMAALLLLTVALTACMEIEKADPLDKFSSSEIILSGGKTIENALVKSVTLTEEGENTVLLLSFGEADIPKYTLRVLKAPARLTLTLNGNIKNEAVLPEIGEDNDLLHGGFFKEESKAGPFGLYLNLKSDIQYLVLEKEGELKITFKKADGELENGNYCVLLNAFDEYENGFIDTEMGLSPTLGTSDGNTEMTLVSQAFASREEADTYAGALNEKLAVLLPEKTAYVTALDSSQLPVIDPEANLTAVERNPVSLDSGEAKVELVLQRARYLTEAPDGTLLFAHPEGTAEETTETLIAQNKNGERTRLDIKKTFHKIGKAQYSSSGRYLAMIDEYVGTKNLIVYDFDNQRYVTLSENGYSGETEDFIWNENSQTLYTVSNGNLFRLDLSSGKADVKQVKAEAQKDSKLFVSGDIVFFTGTGEEGSTVNTFDFDHEKSSVFCKGKCVAISPSGDIIVVERASSEEGLSNIFCVDVATGGEVVVKEKIACDGVLYYGDAQRILFCVENDDQEYPFRIETFWTEKNMVQTSARLMTKEILLEKDGKGLMLTDNVTFHGKEIPMTYRWSVDG